MTSNWTIFTVCRDGDRGRWQGTIMNLGGQRMLWGKLCLLKCCGMVNKQNMVNCVYKLITNIFTLYYHSVYLYHLLTIPANMIIMIILTGQQAWLVCTWSAPCTHHVRCHHGYSCTWSSTHHVSCHHGYSITGMWYCWRFKDEFKRPQSRIFSIMQSLHFLLTYFNIVIQTNLLLFQNEAVM